MGKSKFPYSRLRRLDEVVPDSTDRMGSGTVDKQIYFCKSCKRCWQSANTRGIKCYGGGVEYYEDFPSINKKRVNCLNCQKK